MNRRDFFQRIVAAVAVVPFVNRMKPFKVASHPVKAVNDVWTEEAFNNAEMYVTMWPCPCGGKIPDPCLRDAHGMPYEKTRYAKCLKCGEEYRIDVRLPDPSYEFDDTWVPNPEDGGKFLGEV